jgi:S1-C subfamily serine protease
MKSSERAKRILQSAWLWGALAGLMTGALAAWAMTTWRTEPELARLSSLIALGVTSTAAIPEPEIEIIPIESRPLISSLPAAFDERRRSPALELVTQTGPNAPLTSDQAVGIGVAATSDGWLITSSAVLEDAPLSTLAVSLEGTVRTITRAVQDKATGILYLKIDANDLPVADFLQARDVVEGAAAWSETRPGILRPETIISTRTKRDEGPVSSEVANRRFLLTGTESSGKPGHPVWDGRGKLIGLYEAYRPAQGAWLVSPVSSVGRDLGALLSTGEITHAGLLVFALDLNGVSIQNRPEHLPANGAWLRAGTEGFSISRNSPLFAILEPGDVIEQIERDILGGGADLGELLLEYRPGVSVIIRARRGEETLNPEVILEEIRTSVVLR